MVWVKGSEMPAGQWSMVGLQIWWRSLHQASALCTPSMHGCITPQPLFLCAVVFWWHCSALVLLIFFTFLIYWSLTSVICRLIMFPVSRLLLMPFNFPLLCNFTASFGGTSNALHSSTHLLTALSLCSWREVWGLFLTSCTITGSFELKFLACY